MPNVVRVHISFSQLVYVICLVLSNIPAERYWLKLAHSCFDSVDICLFD